MQSQSNFKRLLAGLPLVMVFLMLLTLAPRAAAAQRIQQVQRFYAAQQIGNSVRAYYRFAWFLPTGVQTGLEWTDTETRVHVFPIGQIPNYNTIANRYLVLGTEAVLDMSPYDPINDVTVTNSYRLGPKVPLGAYNFFRTIELLNAPEITVKSQGGYFTDSGGGVSFLNTAIGLERTLTFEIGSTGSQGLAGLAVTIAGNPDFTVNQPPATLAPGEVAVITVRFRPAGAGLRTATLNIASNDPDENPFTLLLAGTGTGTGFRKIEVRTNTGALLANGSGSQNFGTALVPSPVLRNVIISNTGNLTLDNLAVTLSGIHAADFSTGTLPASLAPGASATLAIHFTPSAAGVRTATLSVASNDSANNPYTIQLTGDAIIPVTFANWIQESGLAGEAAGWNATPFGDGVPNQLKYAFNLNPSAADFRRLDAGGTAGLPLVTMTPQDQIISTRMEYLRRKNSDLTYTPKRSYTLLPGSFKVISGPSTVTSIDDEWERVVMQFNEYGLFMPTGFYTVEVTAAP